MILASLTIKEAGLTYVLTQGRGTQSFEEARKYSDFAVYFDDEGTDEDEIHRHGHKCSRQQAAALFGGLFGLEEKHFRL